MNMQYTPPKEPNILKDVFGGLLQTKQYVIDEIYHWGSPSMNPSKMWDDAVRAGRIKKVDKKSMFMDMYDLDGMWAEKHDSGRCKCHA